jgi:hypothetical protein
METLVVKGTCTFPTPGYTVTLTKAHPQGINKEILLLNQTVTAPTGIEPEHIVELTAKYEEKHAYAYKEITILPDGPQIKVEYPR